MLTEFLLQRPTLDSVSRIKRESVPQSSVSSPEAPVSTALSTEAYRLELSSRAYLPALGEPSDTEDSKEKGGQGASSGEKELSPDDERKVQELRKIDQKVHVHEQAHLSAAAGYARGGAQYEYASGPDGNRYAVAGHVSMDTSRESSPEKTLQKANTVRKAALAPADPSSADRQIAASMGKMAEEARAELSREAVEGASDGTGSSESGAVENSSSVENDEMPPVSSAPPTSQFRQDGAYYGVEAYQIARQSISSGQFISLVA